MFPSRLPVCLANTPYSVLTFLGTNESKERSRGNVGDSGGNFISIFHWPSRMKLNSPDSRSLDDQVGYKKNAAYGPWEQRHGEQDSSVSFVVSEDEFTTRRFDTSSSINDSNQYCRQYKCSQTASNRAQILEERCQRSNDRDEDDHSLLWGCIAIGNQS